MDGLGDQGSGLYLEILEGVRLSLEAALRKVFLVGAVTMLLTSLLVLTIPEIDLEMEAPDRRPASQAT